MNATVQATLGPWVNFYLITGTAAATLTGLQFIVQTLLTTAEVSSAHDGDHEGGIAAFGSPTVVHLSMALIVSAVICAPWPDDRGVRLTLGVIGAGAVAYSVIVFGRTRNQTVYRPEVSDWTWHVALPLVAYVALFLGAIFFDEHRAWPEFAIAATTLLLICIAIHNAWDTVTYLTIAALRIGAAREQRRPQLPPAAKDPKRSRTRRRH